MLRGRALRRRAAIAAAIPPLLRLQEDHRAHVAQLCDLTGQPERLVADACAALQREGWVIVDYDNVVTLTATAERTLDEWETDIQAALG